MARIFDPVRRAGFLLSALAAVCLCATTALADRLVQTLGPLEGVGWPSFLDGVDLDPDRAYVVLVQAPTFQPVDLKTPDDARKSLFANAFGLKARTQAKTVIGHVMVGWQCSTGRGFASQTGESSNQGTRMAMSGGWGVTALLSTFLDGRVDGTATIPEKYNRIVGEGDGNVVVVETTEAQCQQLRRFVADYVSHPNQPAKRYSMLLEPDKFEGGGCASFAMAVAKEGGMFSDIQPAFRRRLAVAKKVLGRRLKAPDGVEPYVLAHSATEENVVAFPRMMTGSWAGGEIHSEVNVVDPELIFAGVTRMRTLAGAVKDWRQRRALSDADPVVARAGRAARSWAEKFRTRRIADPDGASALVLER